MPAGRHRRRNVHQVHHVDRPAILPADVLDGTHHFRISRPRSADRLAFQRFLASRSLLLAVRHFVAFACAPRFGGLSSSRYTTCTPCPTKDKTRRELLESFVRKNLMGRFFRYGLAMECINHRRHRAANRNRISTKLIQRIPITFPRY